MKAYEVKWEVSDCGVPIKFDSYYTIDFDKANVVFEFLKKHWKTLVEAVYDTSFDAGIKEKICYTFKTGDITRGKQKSFWANNGVITYFLQCKTIDIDE